MADEFNSPIPEAVFSIIQQGLMKRQFHDALYPALQYRAEAIPEKWEGNTGSEMFETRVGLLAPITQPLRPGTEPQPQAQSYEQWRASLKQFSGADDVDMKQSATAISNTFLSKINTLGLQAGQSVNRLARNSIIKRYLEGNTVLTVAALNTDTILNVASLSGFRESFNIAAGDIRPQPVAPFKPLVITINGAIVRNVVGWQPNDPGDIDGPGRLLLDAAVGGAGAPIRSPVLSSIRPQVVNIGGGTSVDAISASDIVDLQSVINAVAILRDNSVQPHEDGFFHCHISATGNAQLFADPVFQRLNTSLPQGVQYSQGFVGWIAGVMFFMNTEAPNHRNASGRGRVPTGNLSYYSPEIASETTNATGVNIGHTLLTGRGAMRETWFDEGQLVSEAGLNGKVGSFQVVNNNISIDLERIRLVIRAPMDRLQQFLSIAWSISTDFPIPTDITATVGPELLKRAIVIRHAI